jgi:hypothetical protein
MKIRELIEMLQEFDQELEVIMSNDEEGNGYSPLSDVTEQTYVPDTSFSGDIYDIDSEEDYEGEDGVPSVVLWPTN